MATTTITVASFRLALAECADAIVSEDWKAARSKYAVAEAILAGLEESMGDASGANLKRKTSLEKLNAAITAAKGEASEQDNASTTFVDLGHFRD